MIILENFTHWRNTSLSVDSKWRDQGLESAANVPVRGRLVGDHWPLVVTALVRAYHMHHKVSGTMCPDIWVELQGRNPQATLGRAAGQPSMAGPCGVRRLFSPSPRFPTFTTLQTISSHSLSYHNMPLSTQSMDTNMYVYY